MPHTVEGFMKKSQKEKFVRNRDIKLKEKEIRTEEKIQKGMSEGVCPRCRDKAQWRFQYGKYKPLKKVATCGSCRQKNVTKAYRTLCDKCASTKKKCPGCCEDIVQQLVKRKERDEFLGVDPDAEVVVDRSTAPALYTGKKDDEDEEYDDEDEMDEGDDDEEGEENDVREGTEDNNKKQKKNTVEEEETTEMGGAQSSANNFGVASWNAERFEKIAANKYSKERVVGAVDDSSVGVFDFANGKT